jgi:hypothetical protein
MRNIIWLKENIGLSNEIEVRKDGVVLCVCKDESCLYDEDIIKDMKASGYKFYQNGKIYKPEKKQ